MLESPIYLGFEKLLNKNNKKYKKKNENIFSLFFIFILIELIVFCWVKIDLIFTINYC